jgi:hypothetical protein
LKQTENNIAHLKYDDDVLYVVIKESVDLGIKEMDELLEFSANFTNYEKRYTVVDTRSNYNSSQEVSNHYAKSEYNKYRYADAFIVNSLGMRLLVNFYIRFHKPEIPTRLFNDEQSAINWIKSLKKEQILAK